FPTRRSSDLEQLYHEQEDVLQGIYDRPDFRKSLNRVQWWQSGPTGFGEKMGAQPVEVVFSADLPNETAPRVQFDRDPNADLGNWSQRKPYVESVFDAFATQAKDPNSPEWEQRRKTRD